MLLTVHTVFCNNLSRGQSLSISVQVHCDQQVVHRTFWTTTENWLVTTVNPNSALAKSLWYLRFLFTSTPKHFSHCASVSFVLIIIEIRIQKYIGPNVPGLVVVRNYHTNHYCCLLIRTSSIKECRFFHNLLLFVTEEFHLRRALKPRPFKFLL